MSKPVKWILIIVVLLLVILGVLKATGSLGKDEGTPVVVEAVELKTITETVNASGKVYPEIEVKISPDISGEIVELTVKEGDSVKRGQLLAKIYADILVSQRDQVSAGVNQANAQLGNSTAGLGALKASLDQAEINYNRSKKLYDEKVISRAEFEQTQQALAVAKANFEAAKEGLKSNDAAIASARAQLTRANKDLSRTTIVAPMDGVVSLMNIKKGEKVAGNSFNVGTEMMRIADLNSIVTQVDVGENDIPKVKLGDTALINVDAYSKRKFKGVVFKIANPMGNALGGNTSTDVTNYKVHIRILKSSYEDLMGKGSFPFRPGMSASADIQTRTERNVISVPLNAVTTRNKKDDKAVTAPKNDNKGNEESKEKNVNVLDDLNEVVFVYDTTGKNGASVKKVKVKTGIQDLTHIQITEGLSVGQQVVSGPYYLVSKSLKEGDKVKKTDKDKVMGEGKKD
ncbi:MAG: efflux RND transporter periplasmic adaptor subunit [Chitinophagaceae bacterium]|jgi:HlyD family secretion protein